MSPKRSASARPARVRWSRRWSSCEPRRSVNRDRPVRVLIVDDHEVVRRGTRELLDRADGIDVVGEAQDGQEAVALARQLRPDVVLMDVAMPGTNGVEA